MKPERFLQGSDAITEIAVASILLGPLSIALGIPAFLLYAIRRPPIGPRIIYPFVGAIFLTSYLYLIWLEAASRNS
jgi:hypothetical protein